MMEKIVEDIEREEDEQERKRKKLDSRREFNLTDEEKRSRIHAEALKRMEETVSNMKGVSLLLLNFAFNFILDFNETSYLE
jgi:CRISPR/Cas system-associated endonuclease Cas3-HD